MDADRWTSGPDRTGDAMTDKVVRIAGGQGFWGDWLEAPVRQVRDGPIDYLMMDYLAEVTMSIMQKQRSRNPKRRVRARLRAADGADPPRHRREGHPGHLQRRRRQSARLCGGGARVGAEARARREAQDRPRDGRRPAPRPRRTDRGRPRDARHGDRPAALGYPRSRPLRQRLPRHAADGRGAAARGRRSSSPGG